MSAKWRAIQHRHRYTYSAVIFPPHFTQALSQEPRDSPFFTELKRLITLNSTYAQLEHAKKVASAFSNLVSDPNADGKTVSCAVKYYLELLFLENSLPLHRTFASVLAKCNKSRNLIEECFRNLCEKYSGGRKFCVSRAALSMMSTPKLGYLVEVVERCAVLVGFDVVLGLSRVVDETNDLSRPSPIVMEQCQEALSCLYYLVQRFPGRFCNFSSEESVLEKAFVTLLDILKSEAFSRDCFVASGVSFCAALQVCLSPDELGFFIMQVIFGHNGIRDCGIELDDVVRRIPYKGDLIQGISGISPLSRLCLIRGILTAVSRDVLDARYVVSIDGLSGCGKGGGGGYAVNTILYDSILPELCSYAERPRDSHSNFHTLTVMQICLQQIKTLLQCGTGDVTADNYDPITEEMGARILKIVWNNLEDPLSQTVKQVHLIFDLYLDILSSLKWSEGSETIKFLLRKIASDLLCLGPRCKGRYVPLASLTRRLGAKTILDMNSELLFETTKAYIDDDVCCAATTFLKCFLECLRDEYWSRDGVDSGYERFRSQYLLPVLHGLACGIPKLRSNVNTYALPVLLEVDVDGIFSMLASIGIEQRARRSSLVDTRSSHADMDLGNEQQIAVLVSLLKVSRSLALMEGDIDWSEGSSVSSEFALLDIESSDCNCVIIIKGIEVKIPVKWLLLALTHIDESLRMDAAETLFLNPKTASLPSHLELSLMRAAVPLNMRSCSSAFLMKWNSLFRKFFARVRTALERQQKLRTWKSPGDVNGVSACTGAEKVIKHRAEYLFEFIKWLSCFLFFSCYPSAPYERKVTAMELMLIMLNVWPLVLGHQDGILSETNLHPYSESFTSSGSTLLLVGSIIDSWDRLRESSFRILLNFPNPLPGISSPDLVAEAVIWAKNLVCSPRVRESDAGALTLRLIFRKYVFDLGWIVRPSCNFVSFSSLRSDCNNGSDLNGLSGSPVVIYVASLVDWLLSSVEDAEGNLSEACKNSFVHGILLTLRYMFEELDWNTDTVLGSIAEMRHVLQRLLGLVKRITSLALWVVSADALYLPEDMEDMVDDEEFSPEISDDNDPSGLDTKADVKTAEVVEDMSRSEQVVMVGCWLAMKEVSLLLGTIIRKVPLPSSEETEGMTSFADKHVLAFEPVLDLKQLETIGSHFLEVLFKMKHNGAIDKTRAGFTALCNRLLCSNDPRLCKLTESWMEQLMERTVAKGQTVDDLLRRSAGIPAAFIAFFLSEPEGTPKRMLPNALQWLIDLVKKSQVDLAKANNSILPNSDKADATTPVLDLNGNKELSKFRDEGVVPTVHAFNVLRAAFNDTNLATDTSGFSTEAMIAAIRSFSSPYWEVRNSACLAYTALVRRMVGFLNIHKRESARRAITGLEFFHRYPTLHSFLYNELKVATEMLSDGSSERLNPDMKNIVHPSLCPILILLSRLKPSPLSSEKGDGLDPFLFMPFIRRCSFQSNYRIRILASTALTGLVSNEKLQVILLNFASELPRERNHTMVSDSDSTNEIFSSSFNSIHGMLLQLNSLIDNNCRNLADSSKKDMILQELIQILATRMWIGQPQDCPCPVINCCMLKVLDNMLSISRTCETSKNANVVWKLLWELSSTCLDLKPSDDSSYFDPTLQELRRQAATSYFNCIFHTTKEAVEDDPLMRTNPVPSCSNTSYGLVGDENGFTMFQERLIRSMSDASYEVRLAVLKWLLLFLKAAESSRNGSLFQIYFQPIKTCLVNINLQETIMKLLGWEKHHKCIHYLLRILYTWNMHGLKDDIHTLEPSYVCSMDFDAIFLLWNKMVSIFKIARHAKMRQTLICCLGMCAKRISDLFVAFISSEVEKEKAPESFQNDPNKMFSEFYDSLSYFVVVIEQNSDASAPVNMRKAAAESIVASGLLIHVQILGSLISKHMIGEKDLNSHFDTEEAVRIYTLKLLDLWMTCIKLLEDEDVELRKRLALDVQKCLSSGNNLGSNSNQVERVIELCFEHLSTVFGHWLGFVDYVCFWVLNAANNANYSVSGGDLVRRVFDKEIDNHHEEKLLICQICCSHLEEIPVLKSQANESEVRDLLLKWRTRFLQELLTFARNHIGKKGHDKWIGGLGNHKDAFLPLYANLLAFYALSNCVLRRESESSEFMLDEVSALGEEMNPFLGNPLISNLFSMVVESHEKYIGRTVEDLNHKLRVGDSIWAEFNPYFLLR